ncbi:MAG: helix-turn-helix transcriptional regulator [Kiritimatiellae bacterium]|nr:helix-turn-helix transcriptional regulator [Kiritimatiellia bacterium]
MNIKEEAKIVPGAWDEIKRRHEANLAADVAYQKAYKRTKERGIHAREKAFKNGGKRLQELREIPGFNEPEERAANALQCAILEARKQSGLTQTEIARRMNIPQANVSRIEHNADAITYKTFSAYLNACGFYFSVQLKPIK